MRPFRFFFGLSIAVMVFFFVARFVIPALFIAGFLSILYYGYKKLSQMITGDAYYRRTGSTYNEYFPGLSRGEESTFMKTKEQMPEWLYDSRTITIQ